MGKCVYQNRTSFEHLEYDVTHLIKHKIFSIFNVLPVKIDRVCSLVFKCKGCGEMRSCTVCSNICNDSDVDKLSKKKLDWLLNVFCIKVYEDHILGNRFPFTSLKNKKTLTGMEIYYK